jgi:hypothetical protein
MLDSNKDSLKLEAMKRIIGVSSILKSVLFEIIMFHLTVKMLICISEASHKNIYKFMSEAVTGDTD